MPSKVSCATSGSSPTVAKTTMPTASERATAAATP